MSAPTIDYRFDGGTPFEVERLAADRFRCRPFASASGSQWFQFCVRIDNLDPGQRFVLEVDWPPVASADEVDTTDPEEVMRQTQLESFASVLHRTCVQSSDMRQWHPVPEIQAEEGGLLSVPLESSSASLYLATQIPYTWSQYDDLLRDIGRHEPGAVQQIGLSRAGLPMHAITLPSRSSPETAPVVYIQAYQHPTEFSGPLVADAMARYLTEDPGGRALRTSLTFQIVPVVDVDALYYGMDLSLNAAGTQRLRPGNINRDWETRAWKETEVVHALLESQIQSGMQYVLGLDLHNGWSSSRTSGAAYTVFPDGWENVSEAYRQQQRRFSDWMMSRTDHETPGHHWAHAASGTFTHHFYRMTGALAHTVEFSRHAWWDREAQRYVAPTADHTTRFGHEAARAIVEYWTREAARG